MAAKAQNAEIYRGDSATFSIPITLPAGVALSNPTAVYYVAEAGNPEVAEITKSAAMTQAGGNWTATVNLTKGETLALQKGRHSHFLRVSDGVERGTVTVGDLIVLPAPPGV